MIQKKKITLKDEKILSDACEALIGAVYIDKGYEFVKYFVLNLWKKEIAASNITVLDSKTKLQEYSLKNYKNLPIYKFVSSKGPKHKPIFKVSVQIYKSKPFIGTGKSKRDAEQNAAEILIREMRIN